jgi:hypothetical protein
MQENNNNRHYVDHNEATNMIIKQKMGEAGKQVYPDTPDMTPENQPFTTQQQSVGNQQFAATNSQTSNNYGNTTQQSNLSGNMMQSPMDTTSRPANYDRLPRVFGKAIVAVHKENRYGNEAIVAFKLEDGTVLDYAQMLDASQNGGFQGLRVQENREGELIIRSVPDGSLDNNLDNLPRF